MADMTLEDKVYQLFIVMPYALAGTSPGSNYYTVESGLKNNIKKYPVGGIILNDKNVQSESQLIKLNQDLQAASKLPLIITCDEEGGTVSRLKPILDASDVLDSMYTYKDRGTDVAKANAKKIADYMTKYGFNADFAPVADVWSNPDNKVIGKRAYSDDFEEAASLVGAAVTGFNEGKIACTLKHFPGHGDTTADSHAGVVYVTKTVEQIRAQEFLPFKAGIDAGAEMVMIGHLNVNAIDANTPALFSSTIVTGWLRGELGFKGVVVTDALEMGALDGYTDSEVAINAIAAGV
ncbi:MAG: glycoside hydrolase family 3 protein, partial [Clostridia bacterium]|nr:glycoside hydrolase family 3 protein [Clostridia bacterium]